MKRATYVGPLFHLRHRMAMLQDTEPAPGLVLAQFDDAMLYRDPAGAKDKGVGGQFFYSLGFGWHVFEAKDFEVSPPAPPQ